MAVQAEEIDLNDDRILVERYQAGDRTAFDILYQRYFPRLRSYCQRRVNDAAEAEELAQEAFVRALTALPRFSGERRFYPWVTVIASRLCVDHYRRCGRVRPSDAVDPGSVDDDSHKRLDVQADLDNLDRALCRIGGRHREVLELRERRGMSYAEIADRMEVPRTTVEALLFRARKALRREFIAVSGERLAAVPVLGWLFHHATDLRIRIGDRMPVLSELTGPIAAGGVAAALALTPMGFGGESVETPEPAPAHSAPAPSLAPITTPTDDAGAGALPADGVTESATDDGTGAAGGSQTADDGAAAAPNPVGGAPGVSVYSDGAAKHKAKDMPITETIDDASVGVDPAIATSAVDQVGD